MRKVLWLLAGLLLAPAGARADPSALWHIVHDKCVPHEKSVLDPSPCSLVDISDGVAHGYAILKDLRGVGQFLLIPTARVSGIEDPAILRHGARNYWEDAWAARYFLEERLQTTLPRDDIALAINSASGRSQNQLHIHIDCVRKDVHDAIGNALHLIHEVWTRFPVPLRGHDYRAIRIEHADLDGINPFHVLADNNPRAAATMGRQTLVLVGATFPDGTDGFVLLNDHANPATGDRGAGEELLDHSCAIATHQP